MIHLFSLRQNQRTLFGRAPCQGRVVIAAWFMTVLLLSSITREALGQQAALGEVTIHQFDGSIRRGLLIAADSQKIVIQSSAGKSEIAASEISHIAFPVKATSDSPFMDLYFTDGSRVVAKQLSIQGTQWKYMDSSDREVGLIPKSLLAVRVAKISNTISAEWQKLLRESRDSDAIVVVRGNESLDRIAGIISKIDSAGVSFELDGQQIDIPFSKLAGVVWFTKTAERVRPTVEIDTVDGSHWMIEDFSFGDGSLNIRTPSGFKLSLPISSIASINYASANVKWISELEVLESTTDRAMEFRNSVQALTKVLSPRFVVESAIKESSAKSADKDLYFPGPGRFVFRAPEGFTTLHSTVLRSDVGEKRTDLSIEVWQDDQRVFQKPLRFDQETLDVLVPVQAGKKIRLMVACDSKLQIGTDVQWKQPRLKK